MKRSHLAREIVETIVITLIIFIVIRLMIQSYHIDGVSMQPGLTDGQYVVVNKTAYLLHPPERGDVIVFHFPRNTQVDFIKRVIGLPGDTVRTDGTRVWVNGVLLNEPYISSPANPSAKEWKVPANQYYVLGDNRPQSEDSRYWDYVPKDFIVGKAVLVYWPMSSWQFINTYTSVYSQLKH